MSIRAIPSPSTVTLIAHTYLRLVHTCLAAQPTLPGVGSGRLLPTTHRPYETEARLEHNVPYRPTPSHGAKAPPLEPLEPFDTTVTAANPVDPPAAEAPGVSEPKAWYDREDDEPQRGAGPPMQAPLSGAFIDSPFCSSRPALRELPFAGGHDGATSGPRETAGWGVPTTDTAIGWDSQHGRSMGVPESHLLDGSGWNARFHGEGDCDRQPPPEVAFPARSMVGQTGQGPGLDLTRIRETEPPANPRAAGLSTTVSSTAHGHSSRENSGGIPPFGGAEKEVLWVGEGVHNEKGDRHSMQTSHADWEGRSRQDRPAMGIPGSPQQRTNSVGSSCIDEAETDRERTRRQPLLRQDSHGTGADHVRHTSEVGPNQSSKFSQPY